MKTYTATQLNKSPQEVFAAAIKDGAVAIEHGRHPGIMFNITAEECEVVHIVYKPKHMQSPVMPEAK